jgi:DNA ligase-1
VIELFRKNKMGSVSSWRIWNEAGTIYIGHATVHGGGEIIHTEIVPAGLAGRTLEEQVASRINSRISRQRDKGYTDSYELAANNPVANTLGLPPPMLAKKIGDMRGWPGKAVVQRKLDGFRCISARDGEVVLYTRGGKVLDALNHIKELLEPHLTDDVSLDGELYLHGTSLQTIASWAKRNQPDTARLVYCVYDSVSDDPFLQRYAAAKQIVDGINSPNIQMVENVRVDQESEMWDYFAKYRDEGYEGAMLRTLHTPYESGARSSSLYKVKARHDAEYRVVDIVPGSDGLAILVCEMDGGKRFKTVAPGDHSQKRFILEHKESYIGRDVTVEYANLTADGIPFHCVATRFKELL